MHRKSKNLRKDNSARDKSLKNDDGKEKLQKDSFGRKDLKKDTSGKETSEIKQFWIGKI